MIEDPFNAPSQSNQHWPRRIAKLDRTPKTHKIVSPIGEALLDKKRSVRDAVTRVICRWLSGSHPTTSGTGMSGVGRPRRAFPRSAD